MRKRVGKQMLQDMRGTYRRQVEAREMITYQGDDLAGLVVEPVS